MSIKKGDIKYDFNYSAGVLLLNEIVNRQDVIQEEGIVDILKSEEKKNMYVEICTVAVRKRILSEIKRTIIPLTKA